MKIELIESNNNFSFHLKAENIEEAAKLLRMANGIKKQAPSVATYFSSDVITSDFFFDKKSSNNVYNRIRDGKTSL